MLKKLLIPFFVISVAAVASNGCGSSSTPAKDGGAGAGTAGKGTAGAGGGTAGAGTAGAGTAGATVDAGTAGAGTAGAGTDAGTAGAGTDAGTAGATVTDSGTDSSSDATEGGGAPNVAALKLECPTKIAATTSATPFTAEDFCALYADACGAMTFTGALTSADCVATYTAWASKKVSGMATVGVQNCVSYHVCNAELPAVGSATTHCPHAAASASPVVCTPAN
jgi:hypothetical protein